MGKVNSVQVRKNSDSLVDGGSESAYITIANDAITPTRMGWKTRVVGIPAASFSYAASVSTYSLPENASLDSHVEDMASVWRNGVQLDDNNRVASSPSSTGEWSIEAGTLSIYGDVTTPVVDYYEIKYPVQTAGSGATEGDFTRQYVLTREGTASTFELTIGGAAPSGTSNRVLMEDDSAKLFEVYVSAVRTDAQDEACSYIIKAQLYRGTGAATTEVVNQIKEIISEDDTDCDLVVSANTTDGALKIEFTAPSGKTYQANAWVREVKAS